MYYIIVSSYPFMTKPESIVTKDEETPRIDRPDVSMNNNWRVRDDDSVTAPSTASDVIPDKPSQSRWAKCYFIVTTKPESIVAKDEKTPRIDRPDDSMNNNWRASPRASDVFPTKPSRPRWIHRTVEKRIRQPLSYT